MPRGICVILLLVIISVVLVDGYGYRRYGRRSYGIRRAYRRVSYRRNYAFRRVRYGGFRRRYYGRRYNVRRYYKRRGLFRKRYYKRRGLFRKRYYKRKFNLGGILRNLFRRKHYKRRRINTVIRHNTIVRPVNRVVSVSHRPVHRVVSVSNQRVVHVHQHHVYHHQVRPTVHHVGVSTVHNVGGVTGLVTNNQLRIVSNRIFYGGHVYSLNCGRTQFTTLWQQCLQAYGSSSVCFTRLGNQHLYTAIHGGVSTVSHVGGVVSPSNQMTVVHHTGSKLLSTIGGY